MRRTLIRVASIGALVGALATVTTGAAFATHGHTKFGGRAGVRAGAFGPGGFGFGGGFGGGFGYGPGLRAGGPGAGGPGGGDAAILETDLLTPTANFLGISLSTLESDLAGGKTLAQEATANGKTASDLITALVNSETTILNADKAAGWITASQETALIAQVTQAITSLVDNGPPVPPSGSTSRPAGLLQTAATYLGISVSDLQSDLKGGKSLADVVSSVGNGKTVSGLVSALEAPVQSNLNSAVSAGKITQAQETAILSKITTELTNLVNRTSPSSSTMNSVLKKLKRYETLETFAKRHS